MFRNLRKGSNFSKKSYQVPKNVQIMIQMDVKLFVINSSSLNSSLRISGRSWEVQNVVPLDLRIQEFRPTKLPKRPTDHNLNSLNEYKTLFYIHFDLYTNIFGPPVEIVGKGV